MECHSFAENHLFVVHQCLLPGRGKVSHALNAILDKALVNGLPPADGNSIEPSVTQGRLKAFNVGVIWSGCDENGVFRPQDFPKETHGLGFSAGSEKAVVGLVHYDANAKLPLPHGRYELFDREVLLPGAVNVAAVFNLGGDRLPSGDENVARPADRRLPVVR